jgi:excisionase family DNA binding protein
MEVEMLTNSGTAERIRRMEPVAPPAGERDAFKNLSHLLDQAVKEVSSGRRCRLVGPLGEQVELPASAFYILERVAEVMAHGDAITVVPVGQELTTQQAANLLNVSRQFLVGLLESGQIPFTKSGSHRRLRVQDVLEFKQNRAKQRKKALDKLVALSEESGGYPELD